MDEALNDKVHRDDVQQTALRQMVESGEAEAKIVKLPGGRRKLIYKIKPYVPED